MSQRAGCVVRRAGLGIALVAVLGGCNQLLGIPDEGFSLTDAGGVDGPVDAPPDTVVGTSRLIYMTASGDVAEAEDLGGYVIQALLPDDAAAGGFRVIDGVGDADGSFVIADVPDGTTYTLKLVAPTGDTSFYVTDGHNLDLAFEVAGRPRATASSATTALQLALGGMRPWQPGDGLDVHAFSVGTLYPQLQLRAGNTPASAATELSARAGWDRARPMTKGGRVALVEAGDDLEISHSWNTELIDSLGRAQGVNRLIDRHASTSVTMADGQSTTITGSFSPVDLDRTTRIAINRANYDLGYDPRTPLDGFVGAIIANPFDGHGLPAGPALAEVVGHDWSGQSTPQITVDVPHGDPFPGSWTRLAVYQYLRPRMVKLAENSSELWVIGGTLRIMEAAGTLPSTADLPPPSDVEVAGVDAGAGGRVDFDGVAPVHLGWNPVAAASYYEISVYRVYSLGSTTGSQMVATIRTRGAELDIPAEVFAGGEWWAFGVAAVRAGTDYADGRLRLRYPLPFTRAEAASGLFRLGTTCGSQTIDAGEDCDPGGADSSTCDLDCSTAECGDGYRNATAGEACDTIYDSFACDADCSPVVCGDSYTNQSVEDCDDGVGGDQDNGCSSGCRRNSVCGNNDLENLFETCDDGNDVGGDGCSTTCQIE